MPRLTSVPHDLLGHTSDVDAGTTEAATALNQTNFGAVASSTTSRGETYRVNQGRKREREHQSSGVELVVDGVLRIEGHVFLLLLYLHCHHQ